MSQKTIEPLNYELKFIAWKMDEIKARARVLVERHTELTKDLDDMSRQYERTAQLLDDLERGHMQNNDKVVDGIPMFKNAGNLVSEFGTSASVRFADPENSFVKNEDGDALMCACGKKSVILIAGTDSFTAMCHACRDKLYSEKGGYENQ